MNLNKLIISTEIEIKNHFISNNLVEIKDKTTDFEIYYFINNNDEELKIFLYVINIEKSINYIKENFDIFKAILIGGAEILSNYELKSGDIVIPNTLINNKNEPIFLEYAIGENYDLKKFRLILNGILYSGEKIEENEFFADIIDKDSYEIAKMLFKNGLDDKLVLIKYIKSYEEENKEYVKNLINIINIVL